MAATAASSLSENAVLEIQTEENVSLGRIRPIGF
jgi:hypothetical protein